MEKVHLSEAFKKLDLLNEEEFNIQDRGDLEDARKYDDESVEEFINVIDPDARLEDDLKPSYIGNVILDCEVCHSKLYKEPEEVYVDEASDLVNVGEECPFCMSTDGYKVIGQVAPYEEMEVTVDGEEDEETDDMMEQSYVEAFDDKKKLKSFMKKNRTNLREDELEDNDMMDVPDRGSSLNSTISKLKRFVRSHGLAEECENEECDCEKEKDLEECDKTPMDEDFKTINVDGDEQDITIEQNPNGGVTVNTVPKSSNPSGEEMIEPVEPDMEADIMASDEEVPMEDETVDYDVDDFDEDSFNDLGEAYLKKVYENVNSFKTTSVKENKNSLVVEGVITFKSGKTKNTKFVFESYAATKNGKVTFKGLNEHMSRGKKSFTLNGTINNKKLVSESLTYNYRTKDSTGKSTRVYGTVKR